MPSLPPVRPCDNIIAVLDSIRRHVAEITERNDPDEILAADDALWSLWLDREMRRVRPRRQPAATRARFPSPWPARSPRANGGGHDITRAPRAVIRESSGATSFAAVVLRCWTESRTQQKGTEGTKVD